MKCTEDRFLLQVMEEPARRGAILDHVLIYKDVMVRNVVLKSS